MFGATKGLKISNSVSRSDVQGLMTSQCHQSQIIQLPYIYLHLTCMCVYKLL